MNTKLLLLTTLITLAALYFFFPSEEKKIRRNLDSLAEYCSSSAEEGPLPAFKKVMLAGKLCLYPCRVQVESQNINRAFSKKELSDHLLLLKKRAVNTQFSFHDTVVNFPIDDQAEVLSTLSLDGKTKDSRFTDAYELKIQVKKRDGDWLFSSFTVVEFMEK